RRLDLLLADLQALPERCGAGEQDLHRLVAAEVIDTRLRTDAGEQPYLCPAHVRNDVHRAGRTGAAYLRPRLGGGPGIDRARLRLRRLELDGNVDALLAVRPVVPDRVRVDDGPSRSVVLRGRHELEPGADGHALD